MGILLPLISINIVIKQRSIKTLSMLLALLLLSGCEPSKKALKNNCFNGFEKCIIISGELRQEHVDRVTEHARNADLVVISSPGGQSGFGRRIGQSLHENKLPLLILDDCSSSCAEYIMPGAAYVLTVGDPIIAFHGNSMINRDIAIEQGYDVDENCWPILGYIQRIYAEKGLNYEFVEMQKAATGPPEIEFVLKEDGCLYYEHYAPAAIEWRPSIEIMRDIWRLDIRKFTPDQ